MSTPGQPESDDVDDLFPEKKVPDDADAGKTAKDLILEDSEERTEHPEETGAASSQTIPEII